MEFKLPELGENIESGDVINVMVNVGDSVTEGQSILEIEAGKASMEIPSPASGTITALHVAQGDTVTVGQLVIELEAGGQESEVKDQESEVKDQESEVKDQESEVSDQESEVKDQESEVKDQESEVKDQESEVKDQESEVSDQESEPAPVVEEKPEPASPISDPRPLTPVSPVAKALAVSASPKVRRLARELGVDIHLVPPSGPAGFITDEDVKKFAKSGLSSGSAPATAQTTRVEKMNAVRKATMNHMSHCWATIPHVTQHDMADITELERLRKLYAPKAEAVGAKLTMTAMLIKIISSALKVHPKFNCSIDSEKGEILYKNYYNIGIAMDTPKGLLVPVIRDGDKKNMVELAVELNELAQKARDGKIDAAGMKGGTFTFTNLGGIGGSFFTPIVNSPEVAILGAGRAKWEPGIEDGRKHFRLPLSLSYDHRIIDGADGARFLKWIIDAIEEPLLLSLEG
ncbi:MAG: 2-oxo acid dehydrogenase subunit E2 [Kiritimatiellales bacterium]|nr:2-oxo acid dehydrogenase subunit E2 [Kiritimatiellales bacterium]